MAVALWPESSGRPTPVYLMKESDVQLILGRKYPGLILKHSLQVSSIETIALSCRKTFDTAKGLTGAKFSQLSDSTLTEVAEYWANGSGRPNQDAYAALDLIRPVTLE